MRGFTGVRGVEVKGNRWGFVHNKSSVRTLRSVTKISWPTKRKCPTTVISRPSSRSKDTRGTRIPSKYLSQQGNCWNLNLIESMKDEVRKPRGKFRDEGCLPTLVQMVTGGRGPLDWSSTLW